MKKEKLWIVTIFVSAIVGLVLVPAVNGQIIDEKNIGEKKCITVPFMLYGAYPKICVAPIVND